MADNREVLTEDELEALAEGVASGSVAVEGGRGNGRANVALYDFHQPAHLLKARVPAMDLVNERFCRDFQASLFRFLQRMVEIEAEEVQMLKFADYLNGLAVNSSVNRVRVNELNGSMLFTLSTELVYVFVDCFFGGRGDTPPARKEREFTVTEKRVVERALNLAFADLSTAWQPVTRLSFSFMHAESRAQMGSMAESTEIVTVSKFKIKMGKLSGEMHLVMPQGLLEPLRPLLASGVKKGHADSDENWRNNLRRKLAEIEIDINAVFTETEISVGDLLSLKPGDFIPVNMSEMTLICAEEVPLFAGKIGMSNQRAAVRVGQWLQH